MQIENTILALLAEQNTCGLWSQRANHAAMSALIIIPARMASTRLPGKPLADIAGQPMIVHVWKAAEAAKMGPVLVACAEEEIKDAVERAGGTAELTDPELPSGSDRVRAIVAENGRALYFTRAAAPSGKGPVLHHLGVYAYRRAALNQFCDLPPSPLEKRERLEQLRALEAGMSIQVCQVDAAPHGVDTEDDLVRARQILAIKSKVKT